MEDVEEDAELEWWELRRAQRAKQTTAGRSDPLPFAAGGSGAQRQQQQSCPLEGEAGASAVAAVLAAEATGHAWWPLGGLPAQGMGAAAVGGGGSGQHVDLGQPGGHGWGVAQILPPTAAGAAASLGSGTDGVASRMVPVSELGADPPPPFLEPAPPVLGKRKLGGAAAASAKAHAARSGAASAARRLFPDDDGGGSVSRGSSGASGSRNATGPDDADPAVEFAAVEFAEYEQERTSIFSRLGADRAAQVRAVLEKLPSGTTLDQVSRQLWCYETCDTDPQEAAWG